MSTERTALATFCAFAIAICSQSLAIADTSYDLYLRPGLLENSYASLEKEPWRNGLLEIKQYCEKPELIGIYDIETLGLLWISKLSRYQDKERVENCEQDRERINSSEISHYLSILKVLGWANQSKSESADSRLTLSPRFNKKTEQTLYEEAVKLVRSYSQYYRPIKEKGAFAERSTLLREDLTNHAGEAAVQAMEDDYVEGGDKLLKLTHQHLKKLRTEELSSLNFVLNEAKAVSTLRHFSDTASASDAKVLDHLWQDMVDRNYEIQTALKSMKERFPQSIEESNWEVAITLEEEDRDWLSNLPTVRPAGFGLLLGDNPRYAPYCKQSKVQLHEGDIQLVVISEGVADLISSYMNLKETHLTLVKLETERSKHKSTGFTKGFLTNSLEQGKEKLSKLVGAEAVGRLQKSWNQ
ncbi:MAG: hypothetical protein K2Y39_20495 [Candidatus Obscuribacterales bacterium]|nr:hypothetical protein [Candidatus Obscuribacterales bacterium]